MVGNEIGAKAKREREREGEERRSERRVDYEQAVFMIFVVHHGGAAVVRSRLMTFNPSARAKSSIKV